MTLRHYANASKTTLTKAKYFLNSVRQNKPIMKTSLFAIFLLLSITVYSQKVKLVSGSLAPLKGEPGLNVEFTYDNMTVGDDLSEKEYVDKKKRAYNEKEPGRGDKWEQAWFADRTNRFEPNFIELFVKYSQKKVTADGKYTLIFNTTRTEPGFNVGVARKSARIDAKVQIVETANRSNIIAHLIVDNAPGRGAGGYDFDSGFRIEEAYAKSGKEIGKLIVSLTK